MRELHDTAKAEVKCGRIKPKSGSDEASVFMGHKQLEAVKQFRTCTETSDERYERNLER